MAPRAEGEVCDRRSYTSSARRRHELFRPTRAEWGVTSTGCSARSVGAATSTWPWSASAPMPSVIEHSLPDAEVVPAPAAVSHRPARLAWEQTGLPLLAQQVGAKVLHSPFYTCPLRAGCPVTVTVHDATFFTEPEHYDKSRRTFFRSAIKTSLRRAERVIVPSKATRDELIRLLGADPTRHRRRLPRRRPGRVPRPDGRREGPGPGPARPGRRRPTSRSSGPRNRARTCRT